MSHRIRICQLTPCLWGGGTEERIARVLSQMDREEFEIYWMGFGPVREALIDRAGPEVSAIPIARNPESGVEPSIIWRIHRDLRRIRPDVFHVHNWSTSLYGIAAARLANVPWLLYGLGGQDTTKAPTEKRQKAMRAMAPYVDRFTAVCEYLGNDLLAYWKAPIDRVEVLRTGIDLMDIDSAPARVEVRKKLNLPADALVVGTISVLRPVKRIPDLIEAIGLLAKHHPNLHLLLLGNPVGVSLEELRGQAAKVGLEDRFHLPGRVERPAHALPAFDVFVNCSTFEGSSNAIIEAMAAEIPIVGTAVGGTPELVEDGVHGLLVPPHQPKKLAEAIDRLLLDEVFRRRCGKEGRRRVEERHTFETMIAAYLDLYRRLGRDRTFGPVGTRLKTLTAFGESVRQLSSR